jgi:hypothetical protein
VTAGVAKMATEDWPVEAVDRETIEQRAENRDVDIE